MNSAAASPLPPDGRSQATTPAVVARSLSRQFGEFVAVDKVSFSVSPGEIFGFLGSNGAGKTTTIRILCGLLAPSSGEATVAGFDVSREAAKVKQRIGYMSQRFSLYADLTVSENLGFWASAYGIFGAELQRRRHWALQATDLEPRRNALVRDLPGGFRQRLALVCALLHQPPVVFLDEPTGGVDPEARRRFWDLIDELAADGTTVFVTTHYMDEAERCGRVALMHAGRLLALDSVPRLKEQVSTGVMLEVECPAPARAMAVLQRLPWVGEVALFGNRLHAEVERAELGRDLVDTLRSSGFSPASTRQVTPSLEDVFIRAIRDAETGRAS